MKRFPDKDSSDDLSDVENRKVSVVRGTGRKLVSKLEPFFDPESNWFSLGSLVEIDRK